MQVVGRRAERAATPTQRQRTAATDAAWWEELLASQWPRENDERPERKLCVAIISDAMRLAFYTGKAQKRCHAEARSWLLSHADTPQSYRWWCEQVALPWDKIQRYVHSHLVPLPHAA